MLTTTLDPKTLSIHITAAPVLPPQRGELEGGIPELLTHINHLLTRVNHLAAAIESVETRLNQLEQPASPSSLSALRSPLSASRSPLPAPRPNPAADLLAQSPLFLDLETTGLKKTDAVVEVSIIDAGGNVLFSTLVDPGCPIPPHVSAINGISDNMVAGAPTWAQILPLLQEQLQGRVVVAHNAKFEAKFIPQDWNIAWACSKQLADQMLGQERGQGSLSARLSQLSLQPGPAHAAAGDCLSCLRLVRHLAGKSEPVDLIY